MPRRAITASTVAKKVKAQQHLVAGADPERGQRDDEGVGAVGDRHRLRHLEEARPRRLELPHLGAEDEGGAGDHLPPAAVEIGGDPAVGAGEIEDRDVHGTGLLGRSGAASG